MLTAGVYWSSACAESLAINDYSGLSSIQDFPTTPIPSTGGFLLVLGPQYDSAGMVSGE